MSFKDTCCRYIKNHLTLSQIFTWENVWRDDSQETHTVRTSNHGFILLPKGSTEQHFISRMHNDLQNTVTDNLVLGVSLTNMVTGEIKCVEFKRRRSNFAFGRCCNNHKFQKFDNQLWSCQNWSQVVQYKYLTQIRVKTPLQLRMDGSSKGADELMNLPHSLLTQLVYSNFIEALQFGFPENILDFWKRGLDRMV